MKKMKKLTTLLVAMAAVFVMAGKAQAVPLYYTFDGTVISYGFDDTAGAIASQLGTSFGIGSTVTYTFIVDFDADGFWTSNNGTVVTQTDRASWDFFYTDYVSGDALEQIDGGYWNGGASNAEANYGYDCPGPCGYLDGNSADDWLQISGAAYASDWAVGTTVNALNYAFDSAGAPSQLYADLTLTDISPVTAAVPEPSTLLLLGSGMLGLIAFRRRQLTKQT